MATQQQLGEYPELKDDIQFGLEKGVFVMIDGQLTMNDKLSYQDCQSFKAQYNEYRKETEKAQKLWNKQMLKQISLNA